MSTLDHRLDVIDLYVEDVEGTKIFYERVFGLPATPHPDCVDFVFGDTICHLRDASSAHEFIAPARVASRETGSAGAFVIFVENLDEVCTELTGLGMNLINGPADRATGPRTACFADPAGQIWVLAASRPQTGQPDGVIESGAWDRTPKRIGQVALFVDDLGRATSFYRDLFGLPAAHESGNYAVFPLEGLTVGLLSVPAARDLIEPARVAGSDSGLRFTFCTFVDDSAEVCSELAGHGVKPFKGPADFSFGHRVVSFRGPGGHIWEAVSVIPGADGA